MAEVSLPPGFLDSTRRLAFARISADGSVVEAGAGFERAAGSAVVGRPLADLLVEAQRADLASAFEGARDLPDMPLLLHFAQGDATPVTVVSWLVPQEDGGMVFLGEDASADEALSSGALAKLNARVSELARENLKKSAALERALAELREAQTLLVHREKMAGLGRMTAGVAHELNNPLAYLVNNQYLIRRTVEDLLRLVNEFGDGLGVLEENRPDLYARILETVREIDLPHVAETVPELLDASERGLERARCIVSDLRSFSRLDEARVKEADLNESLRLAIEFVRPLALENGVRIDAEYGTLPLLMCSPGELNQAFSNIIRNAVQATGPGGGVRLATSAAGDEILVTVSDDGGGIDPDLVGRIFEPFFTTKPVGEGTGLGLSIAHTVVSAHGGTISVESAPGRGATFAVRLPLAGAFSAGTGEGP